MGSRFVVLGLGLMIILAFSVEAQYYEGFGKDTRGAEGCSGGYMVYNVTSLANSGPNTLRDALSQGCRYIVFGVGGNITLTSTLNIVNSYITIDGSTAPYPGITVRLTPAPPTVTFQIYAQSGDVTDIIIKYLRFDGQADFHPNTVYIGLSIWRCELQPALQY